MKKENEKALFQTIDDSPRVAKEAVPVEQTIDQNVEDLFTVVGVSNEKIEKLDATPYSYWTLTFKQLVKNPLVIICLAILIILIFFTIFGPIMRNFPPLIALKTGTSAKEYTNYIRFYIDKTTGEVVQTTGVITDSSTYIIGGFIGPNATNWFGVGPQSMGNAAFVGSDLWYCVWKGAQLSLLLGTVVALIDTVVGILIGSLWGYFRWLDPILIEFRNFVNNIPTLLLDILLMQIFKQYMKEYGFWIIVLLLSALGWLGLAGFIRNQILIIRNREYNIASQTLGSSSMTMITHNLLPYLVSVIVTVVSTAIPEAISSEVGLAYFNLSFNASDNQITLGQLLTSSVKDTSWLQHPYIMIAPLVVMVPLTITFFYLGLALADATDPKSHR